MLPSHINDSHPILYTLYTAAFRRALFSRLHGHTIPTSLTPFIRCQIWIFIYIRAWVRVSVKIKIHILFIVRISSLLVFEWKFIFRLYYIRINTENLDMLLIITSVYFYHYSSYCNINNILKKWIFVSFKIFGLRVQFFLIAKKKKEGEKEKEKRDLFVDSQLNNIRATW